MKNSGIRLFLLVNVLIAVTMVSCSQPYFEIPTLPNGEPDITKLSTTSVNPDPVRSSDSKFTVTAYLPNAHEGDKIAVQCLNKQVPKGGGKEGYLPISGTQKELTVGSDLKVSVTYTTAEAKLVQVGDDVLVVFGGKTASAQQKVTLTL
ncbi:MAG TPA: hypothetical protein VFX43_15895 [Chitinophagaceae bacterium]|nr:hypothetical protein [Chitinophagaceae bacterium]